MKHIKACLSANFDPLPFVHRASQSTEDTISTTLHLTVSHLERKEANSMPGSSLSTQYLTP